MIYLDNAATSRYKPFRVKRAVLKEINRSANPGRSSHDESIRAGIIVENCREEIKKRFFDGNVIFTKNCTEALNLGIFGTLPSRQVITSVYDHNSVLRPLKKLADDGKISLKIIDFADEKSLLNALKTPTSLVVFTAMSNVTGKTYDVNSIAKTIRLKSDAKILVDMAQAAGHAKTDLSYVDMCAFAGHKALHGVQGSGFLLARKNVSLSARIFGGTGTSSLNISHPNIIPDGMEAGTLNTPAIAGLREGIKWTYDNFDRLKKKIDLMTDAFFDELKAMDKVTLYAANNGVILFNIKNVSPDAVADFLNSKYKIAVRSGLHCSPLAHKALGTSPYGAVRISLGACNGEKDVITTVNAIYDAVTTLF